MKPIIPCKDDKLIRVEKNCIIVGTDLIIFKFYSLTSY